MARHGRAPRKLAHLAVCAALLAAPIARAATPDDRASARQHESQADRLKKQGKLAEACKELEEVERLDPKLPTLMELAECTEQAGDVVAAQSFWALARDRAKHDEKPQSRARAESRLAAMQKRVAHLTLQLAPSAAGAQVLCDDAPLEAAALANALPMNPGDHVVVVKLPGHDDAKFPIKLADGDNQTLAIAAGPEAGRAAPVAAAPAAPSAPAAASPLVAAPKVDTASSPPPAPATQGFWTSEHSAGAVLGAVGLAAIGGGAALCVVAGKGSAGDSRLALGGISIASGGVLFVSGMLLLATGSSDSSSQHAAVTVAPTLLVARDRAVLGAAGKF